MGLKISTKINDFDYPDEEKIILLYGDHQVDIRPYIMSFLLRCTMNYEPIEMDYFVSKVIDMIDGCLKENGEEFPSMHDLCTFRAKLTSHLVKKIVEIFGNNHLQA